MNKIQIKATLAVAGMMAAFSVSAQNSFLECLQTAVQIRESIQDKHP